MSKRFSGHDARKIVFKYNRKKRESLCDNIEEIILNKINDKTRTKRFNYLEDNNLTDSIIYKTVTCKNNSKKYLFVSDYDDSNDTVLFTDKIEESLVFAHTSDAYRIIEYINITSDKYEFIRISDIKSFVNSKLSSVTGGYYDEHRK